jgi:hypothetical protein
MITFEAPAGLRILRSRFLGITNFDGLWWSYDQREWVEDLMGSGCTIIPCGSYKAFLRHIRKHPELTRATLISRFEGHNVHYEKQPK